MKRQRITNSLLALNAVLFCTAIWILAGSMNLGSSAIAEPTGIPNPAEQRNEMIEALHSLNGQLADMREQMSKPLEIEIKNLDALNSTSN